MKRLLTSVNVFGAAIIELALFGCLFSCVVPERDLPREVSFGAFFAPVRKVLLYTEDGVLFDTLTAPDLRLELEPGTYFVDLQDDYGTSAFDMRGGTNFVPNINGALTAYAPHFLSEIAQPLVRITVQQMAINQTQQGLQGFASIADAKARMVWEAAKAMVGPNGATTMQNNWPTGDILSNFQYAADDPGAWASLRAANSNGSIVGWWINCRHDSDQYNNYTPCSLAYGGDNLSQYGSQGGLSHGGQCKGFMNLVAYRSGVYHGANWAFKKLPSDGSTVMQQQPMATYATIVPGDLLRLPYGHALIVVRKISSSQVVVFDSNWVGGGDGNEVIGSHVLGFSGSGNFNLGNYRNLICVYNESC